MSISRAREVYRPVATRCSLLYFLFDSLSALDRVYHYSMANFVDIMKKGMRTTPGGKDESAVGGWLAWRVPATGQLSPPVPRQASWSPQALTTTAALPLIILPPRCLRTSGRAPRSTCPPASSCSSSPPR